MENKATGAEKLSNKPDRDVVHSVDDIHCLNKYQDLVVVQRKNRAFIMIFLEHFVLRLGTEHKLWTARYSYYLFILDSGNGISIKFHDPFPFWEFN